MKKLFIALCFLLPAFAPLSAQTLYGITSGSGGGGTISRFEATTGTDGAIAAPVFSLLTVSDPGVLLWSLKPSEDNDNGSLITRFWNLNSKAVAPVIQWFRPIKKAWQTTHIETDLHSLKPVKGKMAVNFRAHQINTYRIF